MRNIFKRKPKLNERQCEILRSKNLPEEWRKLTLTQRESIVAIEEMLEYLEKKYNKTFCYAGYRRPNIMFLDEESLLAYAKGDNPETQAFTVERKEDGFVDGYAWVTQAPLVQENMNALLSNIFEGQKYKLFTDILGISDDGIANVVDGLIYIENTNANSAEMLMSQVVQRIKNVSEISEIDMYCFDKGVVDRMDATNHQHCFDIDEIIYHFTTTKADRNGNGQGWERND